MGLKSEVLALVTKESVFGCELKRAVWECGTDKSPGPDGFSFGFYRQFWKSIENDVFAAVSHFFTFGDIPNGCNSCFIALFPKVPDANLVKDFRPISFIGSMHKIIAKILANRLVGVLGDIVNEVQSAFITERQIFDGHFILNEVIQWFKLKKKQSLIFKVDFDKAYDSFQWDFLDDVLKNFGFGNKWCAWIQSCLRSSRGSIIINSSPTEEFQSSKGLKKGLRINMCKSKIMGVNVGDEKVKSAASKLGCLILNTPFSYLGTKVGGNMSRVQAWTEVVDKVKSRLSNWKMKSLSIGAFWDDNWIGGKVLKYYFPRIYALETEKELTVNSKTSDTRLENSLRRSIREGVEQVHFNELSNTLQSISLMPYYDRCIDIDSILCPICECGVESVRRVL
uniref:RNA-directed DNA polymerase, eukaryota, reverse transcriptase zinc-binding domain protein n=1 Tax=Tanacetum cinerariifolium TaxID=118510 RepID=A0A6L2M5M1_TANCI|nr:RNA-directed DNA polymerase, eukaryota, reverse transcriptase zinc-binding domain protein [Tanacetum cinerariifolium]